MSLPNHLQNRDADVIVVGAGPTGLMAAALLARCGMSVRILDQSPTQAKESRAFAIQARTLEVLNSLGLADRFLDRGTIASGARIYRDGTAAAALDFECLGHPDTPFPLILLLPQADTEEILVDHLATLGIRVERGTAATGFEQDRDGVRVRAVDPDGREVTIEGAYLVGADGAHSLVRKALGLTFAGAPYAQTFLLADCTLQGDIEDGPFSAFFHGPDFALWFPLKGGRYGRVIATARHESPDTSLESQGSAPATLPEVEAALRQASQRDLRLVDPVWLSRYRVHHRGADKYGIGRVFVAGDAAHIHSPAGGQGMNTGMQDAFNLAWKLALDRTGRAPPSLLASYDGERRPVGDRVLAATDRAFSAATASSSWASALRHVVLPIVGLAVERSDMVRAKLFHLLSELGIAYEPGGAVGTDAPGWPAGPKPGHRAPDGAVARQVRLFDLIGDYNMHVLAFARRPLAEAEIEQQSQNLGRLAAQSGLDLRTHLIARSLIGRDPRLVQVENDVLLSVWGLGRDVESALYLVRPDGHVAWRAPSFDYGGCAACLAEYFATPADPA